MPRESSLPPPPDAAQMDRLTGALEPLTRLARPLVLGMERIPERGALFVGNHTLYAFLDLPFMMSELWRRQHLSVRALGDSRHYAIPVWRNLLEMCGMVRGTRENVRELMRTGQNVLVFPGGASEVFKGKGQKYRLMWKERIGFAKLAIEFGYPVLPFAAVGAEEMLEIVADERTPAYAQVSGLMKRLIGLPLPPVVRGIGLTPLPKPERLYFWFGDPIETHKGRPNDAAARLLRDEVKASVERGISLLLDRRESDPDRGISKRILRLGEHLPRLAETDPQAWFVIKAFDAWNEQGPDGAAAWMSPWVQLTDPPRWPDTGTRRGRDAVLKRLKEVTEELGADRVESVEARSAGDAVIVSFALRGDSPSASAWLGFHAVVEIEGDEITHIRIFVDQESAEATAPSPA